MCIPSSQVWVSPRAVRTSMNPATEAIRAITIQKITRVRLDSDGTVAECDITGVVAFLILLYTDLDVYNACLHFLPIRIPAGKSFGVCNPPPFATTTKRIDNKCIQAETFLLAGRIAERT